MAKRVLMDRFFQAYPYCWKDLRYCLRYFKVTLRYRLDNYLEEFLDGVPFLFEKNWRDVVHKAVMRW